MTDLTDLMRQATDTAEWRGHRLSAFDVTESASGRMTADAECHCGAWVVVDTAPPANGIDIGGPAVAVGCGLCPEYGTRKD